MPQDEALAMFSGGTNEFAAQTEFVTQLDAIGLGGQKAVRPFLDQQAILTTGGYHPAEAVTGLQQNDVKREAVGRRLPGQAVAGRQARDAATDDHRPLAVRRWLHGVPL